LWARVPGGVPGAGQLPFGGADARVLAAGRLLAQVGADAGVLRDGEELPVGLLLGRPLEPGAQPGARLEVGLLVGVAQRPLELLPLAPVVGALVVGGGKERAGGLAHLRAV